MARELIDEVKNLSFENASFGRYYHSLKLGYSKKEWDKLIKNREQVLRELYDDFKTLQEAKEVFDKFI
jgi:hypothetical protein